MNYFIKFYENFYDDTRQINDFLGSIPNAFISCFILIKRTENVKSKTIFFSEKEVCGKVVEKFLRIHKFTNLCSINVFEKNRRLHNSENSFNLKLK